MRRPVSVYVLAVVGAFAVLGAGFGLASNFTLGFFIEQFVEPGEDPFDYPQVAILFLVAIFSAYALGPLAAGVAGVGVGQALPDRRTTAAVVAGVGSFVGFYLFVGLALFFVFAVLAEYGVPVGGGDGGGGTDAGSGEAGGSGNDSPLDPAGLVRLMVQVSLPTALVGLAAAYLTCYLSGGPDAGTVAGPSDPADDPDPDVE